MTKDQTVTAGELGFALGIACDQLSKYLGRSVTVVRYSKLRKNVFVAGIRIHFEETRVRSVDLDCVLDTNAWDQVTPGEAQNRYSYLAAKSVHAIKIVMTQFGIKPLPVDA